MTAETYPSSNPTHRRADLIVHIVGQGLILTAGGIMLGNAAATLEIGLLIAVVFYVGCALASNIASSFYHFAPMHDRRPLLRRIDHAAIYLSISGTFTPFFIQADTTWTMTLLYLCWGITAIAVWHKIAGETIKTRWSTASYLGLGAVGMCALPDLHNVPLAALWCIIGGAVCYVVGTVFYARKALPFRYAIWHIWVSFGGMFMFAGIWMALFQ